MAVDSMVRLGEHRLRTAPSEIRWNFQMKVNDSKAVGGKVIQINGLRISDITVTGRYTPDRAKGDTHAYEQLLRFRSWAQRQTEETREGRKTLRFSYPPRGWNFNVFIKAFEPLSSISVEDFSPQMQLVLFPVDDTSREVVKGIRDLYIKRLLDGVGWKQTDYNGPTQQEVDDLLGGRSVNEYLADRYEEEAYGSTLSDPGAGYSPMTSGGLQP